MTNANWNLWRKRFKWIETVVTKLICTNVKGMTFNKFLFWSNIRSETQSMCLFVRMKSERGEGGGEVERGFFFISISNVRNYYICEWPATFALNFTKRKHFQWMRSLNMNYYLLRFGELKNSYSTIVLLPVGFELNVNKYYLDKDIILYVVHDDTFVDFHHNNKNDLFPLIWFCNNVKISFTVHR